MDLMITEYVEKATCECTGTVKECVRVQWDEENISEALISFAALKSMIRFRSIQDGKNRNGKKPLPPEKSQ